jgi:RimJ/RimL family protein N-acetyltransferase
VPNPTLLPLPVVGDDLVLRPLAQADAAALPALYDDPDVARYTPIESPFDAAAAQRYLERAAGQTQAGQALHLAITLDGGDMLGEVLAFVPRHPAAGSPDDAPQKDRTLELGYVVGPAHRGQGLATRALRLLGEAVVRDLGATRLVLRIDAGNVASERVAAACGYVDSGVVSDGVAVVWERVVPLA